MDVVHRTERYEVPVWGSVVDNAPLNPFKVEIIGVHKVHRANEYDIFMKLSHAGAVASQRRPSKLPEGPEVSDSHHQYFPFSPYTVSIFHFFISTGQRRGRLGNVENTIHVSGGSIIHHHIGSHSAVRMCAEVNVAVATKFTDKVRKGLAEGDREPIRLFDEAVCLFLSQPDEIRNGDPHLVTTSFIDAARNGHRLKVHRAHYVLVAESKAYDVAYLMIVYPLD